MAGLQNLKELYKNPNFEKLLNKYVIVTEKLNGSRFEFQYSNGVFEFFNKNKLTKIDRTMVKAYESAINYIESLPESIKSILPNNYRFGFEYFTEAVNIKYDRNPKNNLVLTDIQIKDSGNRTKNLISDPKIISNWATQLQVEESSIIFKGKFSKDQKESLIQSIKDSNIKSVFESLNPNLKTSFLNEDLDKPIEGLVFKFHNGYKKKNTIAKLVHPEYLKVLEKRTEQKTSDMSAIVLMNIVEFININGITRRLYESDTELKYIEVISNIYESYLKVNSSKIEGADFNTPEFAKNDQFRLNLEFISNNNVRHLIEKSSEYHDLFKLMLGTFRFPKKRASNDITIDMIPEINNVIKKIYNHINKQESNIGFVTFEEFLNKN